MKVKYIKGEQTKEYTLVVIGDLTGDGELGLGDVTKLAKHVLNKTQITGAYLKAGEIKQDGNIANLGDVTKLAKIVLGKETI